MDLKKQFLLLLLLFVLLMAVDALPKPGRVRVRGRGQVRGRARGRGRGRGRGHVKRPRPASAGPPSYRPVFLQLPGEKPIPIPLLPGGDPHQQPITIQLATHGEPTDAARDEPTSSSQTPSSSGSFDAPSSLQSFRPSAVHSTADGFSANFGDDFFGDDGDFSSWVSTFPDLSTAFEQSVVSRRRSHAQRLPAADLRSQGPVDVPVEVEKASRSIPATISPQFHAGRNHEIPSSTVPSPKYKYGYLINDAGGGGPTFQLQQSADGDLTRGRYVVALPDGRTQVVTYTAGGEDGYVADVRYIDESESGQTYGY